MSLNRNDPVEVAIITRGRVQSNAASSVFIFCFMRFCMAQNPVLSSYFPQIQLWCPWSFLHEKMARLVHQSFLTKVYELCIVFLHLVLPSMHAYCVDEIKLLLEMVFRKPITFIPAMCPLSDSFVRDAAICALLWILRLNDCMFTRHGWVIGCRQQCNLAPSCTHFKVSTAGTAGQSNKAGW